uniref:Uncharacterized protein n=1 Tax=Aegilops tauschii subsp. strangulata TaxID=200361 RepID=A0A453PX30_AEGTS
RHPKPASPPPKVVAVVPSSSPPKPALLASPATKQAPAAGRRSPPAKPARKQPSPTKEKPRQQPIVMEAVRILKRGEDPPADRRVRSPPPATAPIPARAQAPPADKRVLRTTSRIGPQQPAVVPTKKMVPLAVAASYAGPAFSAAAPEPSSLPLPGFFFRRAEEEATRGLRCLLRIGELS